MDASTVTAQGLQRELDSVSGPLVIDVRSKEDFERSDVFLRGAVRRPTASLRDWSEDLPKNQSVVVACVRGGHRSHDAAREIGAVGRRARILEGGLEAWQREGGPILPKPVGASTRWITRERPKIDRIACPWLVSRFIDPEAEFRYVKADEVRRRAEEERAIPFDIPDTLFSHDGDLCSFDAFLKVFRLDEPALIVMARIIRGADTGRLDLAPECAGLLAASLGLSRLRPNDHEMLRDGFVLYDALYLWAKDGVEESHTWNPALYR